MARPRRESSICSLPNAWSIGSTPYCSPEAPRSGSPRPTVSMRWCAEQGSGFATGAGPVPIVVTMALFDLLVGEAHVRPGPVEGYAACAEARGGVVQVGRIGAGTGATIGKWRGREHARPGGLGSATVRDGDLVVSALVAVNAVGDIDDRSEPDWPPPPPDVFGAEALAVENTTIGVVATNAALDKVGLLRRVPRGARRHRSGADALAHAWRWRRDRRGVVRAGRGRRRPRPLPDGAGGRACDPVGRAGRAPLTGVSPTLVRQW